MDESVLRLGLLGGTFDPIHYGHLRAAEEAYTHFRLDRVDFIPSAQPPHKHSAPIIAFNHRFSMVRMAVSDRPGFYVSDVETRRQGPSYTVETLKYFHSKYEPGLELFFIVGMDAFLDVHSWKNYKTLFDLAAFVVFSRPGYHSEDLEPYLRATIDTDYSWDSEFLAYTCLNHLPVHFRHIPGLDVSSTDIRSRITRGDSFRYLTTDKVRGYIWTNRLYQD